MIDYYPLLKPLLFALPPETVHSLTLNALKILDNCLKYHHKAADPRKAKTVLGLTFPNPIGLAAGLDKSGRYIDALSRLGFGFIEIGTITPRGQPGNPKPRLFRLRRSRALINRMGFNNVGIEQCLTNIRSARYQGILGINIGKNLSTPLEQAIDDYVAGMVAFYPHASYITINISSPNTPGLRDLQQGDSLRYLLDAVKNQQQLCQQRYQRHVPLVVKIAPDLTPEQITHLCQRFVEFEIDGIIATNTTNQRPTALTDPQRAEQGGLSGLPLYPFSLQVIRQLQQILQGRIPIIGVGGIQSADEAQAMLQAGADLLQLYTGLIYRGPKLIQECLAISTP